MAVTVLTVRLFSKEFLLDFCKVTPAKFYTDSRSINQWYISRPNHLQPLLRFNICIKMDSNKTYLPKNLQSSFSKSFNCTPKEAFINHVFRGGQGVKTPRWPKPVQSKLFVLQIAWIIFYTTSLKAKTYPISSVFCHSKWILPLQGRNSALPHS